MLNCETTYAASANEEKDHNGLTFNPPDFALEPPICIFPEGVEPWLNARIVEVSQAGYSFLALDYDILANPTAEARTGVIVVYPKDHPGFELARITVTQAGKPADNPGE